MHLFDFLNAKQSLTLLLHPTVLQSGFIGPVKGHIALGHCMISIGIISHGMASYSNGKTTMLAKWSFIKVIKVQNKKLICAGLTLIFMYYVF